MWQPVAKFYTHTKFQSNWISTYRDMAKYVIFKTEVPHLKKEGKMERREKWQLWQKWQPVAQAIGAYGLQT